MPDMRSAPIDQDDDLGNFNPDPALAAPAAVNPHAELAAAIVSAVNDAHGPRKLSFHEWNTKRSVHRNKPLLKRKCFQNGIQLDRYQLTADAIEMLNVLQSGVYFDGFAQVVAMQDGNKLSGIDIRYGNKSVDQRMEFKSRWNTFEHFLAGMIAERQAVALVQLSRRFP